MQGLLNKVLQFWLELKRRKVIRVLAAYIATSYIIIEVINNLSQPLQFPEWISTLVVIILIACLPLVILLSWIFDFSPEGITRTGDKEKEVLRQVHQKPVMKLFRISNFIIASLLVAVVILLYPKVFKRDSLEGILSSGEKVSIVILPFQNLTNDPKWDLWQDGIKELLITTLSDIDEFNVKQTIAVDAVIQGNRLAYSPVISPDVAKLFSKKLNADIIVKGNIMKFDSTLRITAQLINSKNSDILKSFIVEGALEKKKLFQIIDSLSQQITNSIEISKIQRSVSREFRRVILTNSQEAFGYSVLGLNAFTRKDFKSSIEMLNKAVAIDSNFTWAVLMLAYSYGNLREYDDARRWCLKAYNRRDKLPMKMKMLADICYSMFFQGPEEQINSLEHELEIDKEQPIALWLLGNAYNYGLQQYEKAIPEYEKALKIYKKWGSKPWWIYIYTDFGRAYHKAGKFRKEKRLYKKAQRDFPNDPDLSFVRAVLSFSMGDTASGNKYMTSYVLALRLKSVTDADIMTEKAKIFLNAGNMKVAEKYYREALSQNPSSSGKKYELAEFLILNKENVIEGVSLCDEALEVKPDDVGLLVIKGWGLHLLGRDKEALPVLEKSKKLNTTYWREQDLYLREVKSAVARLN